MNSSLKRACVARGRLVHRSKNIERHVMVLPSGAEVFLGMRVSKDKGVTFNQSINLFKRTAPFRREVPAYKRAAWENSNA